MPAPGCSSGPAHRASAATAIPFDPADTAPERLREVHLALAKAVGAVPLRRLLAAADWPALLAQSPPEAWDMAPWARARADIWKP